MTIWAGFDWAAGAREALKHNWLQAIMTRRRARGCFMDRARTGREGDAFESFRQVGGPFAEAWGGFMDGVATA